ncbi:PREDICTED: heat stress transcription factor A-1-like [Lupinus angustifolius]|nr:PREDICTED: heat stress transcription factor A-1-like [Lupinus angustifolius]
MEMEGFGENSNKSQFAVKTFEIVENPETNAIVSWNETRDSFVVWNVQSFTQNILPNYFKHSNFSSFIRQLHFYGFRKVDSGRCEFANEGFKGGMKHLLKNITCKRPKFKKLHQGSSNLMDPNLKDEVEQLKKDNAFLKVEIVKLRQKNQNLDNQVSSFKERIRRAELNRNQMTHFIARMDKMKKLVAMLHQNGQEKEQHDKVGTQYQNVEHKHGIEQLFSLQSEFIEVMSGILKTNKVVNQAASPIGSTCSESLHDESFDFEGMLKKLLGESCADEKVDANHSCIDIELELFLGKSTDWTGFGGEIGKGN